MAQINIYADCGSESPTKTYTARRLLSGVAIKVMKVAEEIEKKKSVAEQYAAILEIVKIVFPQISDEEVECIDTAELMPFLRDVCNINSAELDKATKN